MSAAAIVGEHLPEVPAWIDARDCEMMDRIFKDTQTVNVSEVQRRLAPKSLNG